MPARPYLNPVSALSCSWSLSPDNIAFNFGINSYKTSSNMDGPIYPMPSAFNQRSSELELESTGAPLESVQEMTSTSDNFQLPSVSLHQYPSSTPVKRRIASYRHFLPLGSPNVPAKEMGNYLAIELDKIAPISIVNLPSIVFPDSLLPFTVDEALINSLGYKIWNARRQTLKPPKKLTEVAVQEWLNSIGQAVSDVTGFQPKKNWSSQYANTVLSHPELDCKPDIILINAGLLESINWRTIHMVTEVTSASKWHSTMKRTINNKTYLMFSTQHSRRYVPFLAVCGKIIYFLVSDRQGQAVAEIPYTQPGVYHALDIVRIVVALMFGSDEIIGYDSTIETGPDGEVMKITAGGQCYKVNSTIHAVRGIVGRLTRVWSAHDMAQTGPKKSVIIKDGWIQQGRAEAETDNLLVVKDVTGVPDLTWGGAVQARRADNQLQDDNTLWIRHLFSDRRAYRIHRHLVLSPVGENLSTFSSLGELIAALRDVAVGMSMTSFIVLYLIL